MPGYFTDFANGKLLDQVFGGVSYSPPVTLYIGLSQIPANKTGSVNEPAGGGYARVAVTNNLTNFPAASVGTKANAGTITFPAPTGSWGALLALFVSDAASGGNVLAIADLTTPKTINA